MTKSIKSVKHIVTKGCKYIINRITQFDDGSKQLQVATVCDRLTPQMMDSTSFDWIDSPETVTYWSDEISDEEMIQHLIAFYKGPTDVSGKSINDFINNRNIYNDKIATDIISKFGDKTINISEGFYNWLIETANEYAGDAKYGNDSKLKVVEKMLK